MPERVPINEKSIVILSSYAESLYNFRGDLIRKLIAEGWRVYALAPDYDAVKQTRVEELGAVPIAIALDRNGMNLLRDLRALLALYRLMRRLRPAIFFGYFLKPVVYGAIAAWLARVPRRVVMVAGLGFIYINAEERVSRKARLLRAVVSQLYRFSFSVSDRVIFQNRDDMALMVGAGIAPPDRTTLINGSGVNLDRFPFRDAPEPRSSPTFIWTGRLLREKGVLELIDAIDLVRQASFECDVILVGGVDSNPGSLTADEVQSWHDRGIVRWMGKVDDVRPYLRQADIFVLPSYREGLPRSTQEAMATGLAVITSDVPGCRETVVEGLNGFLVPVRSARGIADAMLRYLRDPDLIRQHSLESRKMAEQRFDVRVINKHMVDVLIDAPQ